MTNTAMADWIDSKDGKADKCYAAYVDGEWVDGCAIKEIPADNLALYKKIKGKK